MYGRDALEGVNVVTLLWTLRSPSDHHAGAACHCVAAGNTKTVVQGCGAHPHFIVVIYDLAALVRKLAWKLVC